MHIFYSKKDKRPELTGGGLVRRLGRWSMIKKLRLKGQDRIKGDERILGEGEFVTGLLSEAKEKFERGSLPSKINPNPAFWTDKCLI